MYDLSGEMITEEGNYLLTSADIPGGALIIANELHQHPGCATYTHAHIPLGHPPCRGIDVS